MSDSSRYRYDERDRSTAAFSHDDERDYRRAERSGSRDRSDSGDWERDRERLGWGSSGGGSRTVITRSDHGRSDRDRSDDRSDRSDRSSSWFGGGSDRDDLYDRDRSARAAREDRSERYRQDRDDRERSRLRDRDREDDRYERDRGYGSDDHRSGLPIDETEELIASNKVEGTAVYGLDGDRLGSIYNFMVNKQSGKVEYATMTQGGFLGLGTRYYPLPWRILKYDTRRGGYRIDMTARDMERAPNFTRDTEPRFNRDYGERVHNYYGLRY